MDAQDERDGMSRLLGRREGCNGIAALRSQ